MSVCGQRLDDTSEVCPHARGKVHSIWKHIESLPIWAQLALLTGFLGTLGLTVKEIVVTSVHMIRGWIESRKTKKIVNYLWLQVNPLPPVPNVYGHTPPSHRFCSSFKIAEALEMSPLTVLQLLAKLTTQQRVDQKGTLDSWKISIYEIEHRKSRNRN